VNRTYPSFETLTAERERREFRSTVLAVIIAGLAVGVVLLLCGEQIARALAP
jgi:ABC-type lipoprotein release transport system permease subunit